LRYTWNWLPESRSANGISPLSLALEFIVVACRSLWLACRDAIFDPRIQALPRWLSELDYKVLLPGQHSLGALNFLKFEIFSAGGGTKCRFRRKNRA